MRIASTVAGVLLSRGILVRIASTAAHSQIVRDYHKVPKGVLQHAQDDSAFLCLSDLHTLSLCLILSYVQYYILSLLLVLPSYI